MILDIEALILDTVRYCEKVRDLDFRSIIDTIFPRLTGILHSQCRKTVFFTTPLLKVLCVGLHQASQLDFTEVRNRKGAESDLKLHSESHQEVPSVKIPLPSGTFQKRYNKNHPVRIIGMEPKHSNLKSSHVFWEILVFI